MNKLHICTEVVNRLYVCVNNEWALRLSEIINKLHDHCKYNEKAPFRNEL